MVPERKTLSGKGEAETPAERAAAQPEQHIHEPHLRQGFGGQARFIFVTGGVCSSIGKGIATASIGAIMKACGFKVFVQKLDPYLNVDPGTMNPFQHGEVYVTDDGAETDLDLGHYERFIDEPMNRLSTVTTGQIYQDVLAAERKGDFLGGTIQVVPHITDAIKHHMLGAAEKSKAEVMMIEIGGTVGDIEGEPYLEAVRQLKAELGPQRTFHVHLTLLPYLKGSKELKTKPTQLSVRELRRIGLHPDMILARADYKIPSELLDKISRFCDVPRRAVIPAPTVHSIYDVPLEFQKHGLAEIIAEKLALGPVHPDMSKWEEGAKRHAAERKPVRIALVGKYTHLDDAYLSVIEAVKSAAAHEGRSAEIVWIDSEKLEHPSTRSARSLREPEGSSEPRTAGQGTAAEGEQEWKEEWEKLKDCEGIVVPGGFGKRGIEGKILAAKYARTEKTPYLGLCLGAQLMTIEFARHSLKDPELTSEEFDEEEKLPRSKYVVHFLPGQHKGRAKGGTLRLGSYECVVQPGTRAYEVYASNAERAGLVGPAREASLKGKESSREENRQGVPLVVRERHRHRYEFNQAFKKKLEEHGFLFSGIWEETGLAEIVELRDHPFMMGSQFHPEFQSRPHRPHPLFAGFMKAVVQR